MNVTFVVRRAVIGASLLAAAAAVAAPRSDASRLRQPAQAGPRETVIVRGSTTWEPINDLLPARFAAVEPKITLDIEQPPLGSTGGIRALIEGTCAKLGVGLTDGPDADSLPDCDVNGDGVVAAPDATTGGAGKVPTLAQSSRPLTANEFATAAKAGLQLVGIQGAKDGLGVVVHAGNPIAQLSQAQIQSLFLNDGAVWNAYGVDLEIGGSCPGNFVHAYTRNTNGGTFDSFIDLMLGAANRNAFLDRMGAPWDTTSPGAPTVTVVDTALDGVAAVAADGCGVFFAGVGDFVTNAGVRGVPAYKTVGPGIAPTLANIQAGTYPFARNMYVATIGVPGVASAEGRFIDWLLSRSGQSIVSEASFVPSIEMLPLATVQSEILAGYPAP